MPERLPDINLLPKYERQSSSHYYLFIVMIVLAMLSYVIIGYLYFSSKSKLKTAEAEYTELAAKADELRLEIDQLEAGGVATLEQAVTFVESKNILTSAFITEINDLLPVESYLSEYEYGNQNAKVTAHLETLDKVANYSNELSNSTYVTDTKVDTVDTFTLKEEETEDQIDFMTIPRYEAVFTLQINKETLKGAQEENE